MPSIKIRVGAALDSNALAVFVPLEKAAERARKNIEKSLQASSKTAAKAAKAGGDALDRELEREANKILKAEEKAQAARTREVEKAAKERIRLEKQAMREIERERAQRNKPAPAGRSGGGGAIGIGRRAAISVGRGTAAAYGYGGAAASSMFRGLGVQTDVSSMVQQGIANQDAAQATINAAPGFEKSSVADRQAASAGLLKEVQATANETATSTGDALDALRAFVAKTGDLDTGRRTLKDLAVLSKATGTSLEDMANAAAEVSNNLGDVPDKAKTTQAVMQAIAGQGKLGAVEIKDLASQMAKLASVAPHFEGDISKNIALMGAMAQESKLHGGSPNATQATTAVMRFAEGMSDKNTLKGWKNIKFRENGKDFQGIEVWADKGHTKLRDPRELIMEALKATGGSLDKLNALFPNKIAKRAVSGFASIYSAAEANQVGSGARAVAEEFEHLTKAAMSDAEVRAAFASQMQTTKSKVQVFNNEMQQTAEKLSVAVLPAFEALAPIVLSCTTGLADFATRLLGTKGPQQHRDALKAQNEAMNAIGLLHRYEESNLAKAPLLGSGLPDPASIGRNLAAAAPVLEGLDTKNAGLNSAIAEYEAKLAEDKKAGLTGKTEAEIADYAAGKGVGGRLQAEAQTYLGDKNTLAQLHDTLGTLQSERDKLYQALVSGNVVVKLAPGAGPAKANTTGTTPANSELPD